MFAPTRHNTKLQKFPKRFAGVYTKLLMFNLTQYERGACGGPSSSSISSGGLPRLRGAAWRRRAGRCCPPCRRCLAAAA